MKKAMLMLITAAGLALVAHSSPPPGNPSLEEGIKAYANTAPAFVQVQEVYLSQVGVVEATGHNDGIQVENYLRSVGLTKGFPWCAAFVRWSFDRAGIRTTITGSSGSCYNLKNVVYANRAFLQPPRPADVIVFYYASLGRIGHTGFFNRAQNRHIYQSCEGNTGDGSGVVREGGGVYLKYRSWKATYAASRWT